MSREVSSQIPPCLHPGDMVALVATARWVTPEEMAPAKKLLNSWQLQVWEPAELYGVDHQLAGSDRARAAMLQAAVDNPQVKAIFCARGGYGTVRILEYMDWAPLAQHPKWVVGYSDVTALHSHIARRMGMATLHATMPIDMTVEAINTPATTSLHTALFSSSLCYDMPGLDREGLYRTGTATAPVVGGNLSILYSLSGTPADIDTRGKILFIEDVDEYLYHIDRMMMNLKLSGKLEHLAGLMVGAMTRMHDNAIPFGKTAEEIVWDAVKDYPYPVAMGCGMGHIGNQNLALPLGVPATLTVQAHGRVHLAMTYR